MSKSKRCNVLLIEDDSLAAELVSRQLASAEAQSHGTDFEVTWVKYLRQGVERLSNRQFDVVLLDLRLPDSQGLESIAPILAHDADASIVVLTGMDDAETAVQAAHAGAHSYLNKRGLTAELLVRSLLYAAESRRRRQLQRRMTASEREINAASDVQRSLIPTEAPAAPGFDISGSYWPYDRVGGDYFDYFFVDGRVGLVIADVSGHGLASALIVAGLRRLLRSSAELHKDVGVVLTIANPAVFDDTQASQYAKFVTAFFGLLDVKTRQLVYATAGHPGFVVKPCGDVVRLDHGDMPLGVMRDVTITSSQPVILQPGDVLVLLTDGFYEVQNVDGDQWGIDTLMDRVHRYRKESADEIIVACYEGAHLHCAPNAVSDDMAMIVVKVAYH